MDIKATFNVGKFPTGISVEPKSKIVYVVNGGSLDLPIPGSVSLVDEISGKVLSEVAVENFPIGIDLDQTTKTAYVANARSDSVSILDNFQSSL